MARLRATTNSPARNRSARLPPGLITRMNALSMWLLNVAGLGAVDERTRSLNGREQCFQDNCTIASCPLHDRKFWRGVLIEEQNVTRAASPIRSASDGLEFADAMNVAKSFS